MEAYIYMQHGNTSSSSQRHAALLTAIRAADDRATGYLARLCAQDGTLDLRDQTCSTNGLTAPPHLHAAVHNHLAVLEELLVGTTVPIDDRAMGWCDSKACCGGRTPLHLACSLGSSACVRSLLRAGANAELPYCWPVGSSRAAADVSYFTAFQIASSLGNDDVMALLVEHGASESNHPDSECPVCLQLLLEHEDEPVETTRCGHRFHARCLPPAIIRACPMCRAAFAPPPTTDEANDSLDGGSEPTTPTLLDRVRSYAGYDICPRPANRSDPIADRFRRAEPPYLHSSAWSPSIRREYSEIERRRL